MTIITGVPSPSVLGELTRGVQALSRSEQNIGSVLSEGKEKALPGVAQPSSQAVRQAQVMAYRDQMNAAALRIRSADAAMAEIGRNLGEMKETLQVIVKQFPPFALNSLERIEYLKQLSGLRKQIDSLTLPAPDKTYGAMLADPARVAGAGELAFSLSNGEDFIIKVPPVHLGEGGLDLPELPAKASDEDVRAMLGRVEKAESRLMSARADMAESVRKAMT